MADEALPPDNPQAVPPEADPAAEGPGPAPVDPGQASLSRALNLSFLLLKALMLAVLALFLLSCLKSVEQNEVGVVRRFGRLLRDERGAVRRFTSGRPYFVWPEPLEELEVVHTGMDSIELVDDFWTRTRAGTQSATPNLPESRESLAPVADGYTLTGDFNIVHTRWRIVFTIDPEYPEDYFDGLALPRAGLPPLQRREARLQILRLAAKSAIVKVLAGLPVEDLLGGVANADPARVPPLVAEELRRQLELPDLPGRYRGGFRVARVIIDAAEPPGRVKGDFNRVVESGLEADGRRTRAEADAVGIRARSRTRANQIIEDARVAERILVANAENDAKIIRAFLDRAGSDRARLNIAIEQHRLDRLREILQKPRIIRMPAAAAGERPVITIAPPVDLAPAVESAGAGAPY